jgi:glycosyltransferase involved in cell wall biosynthesis
MNPKVSICIPAYKQADKLQLLFQTIQQQTFRDFEVIVTDDSPTDEVEKLCRQQSAFDLKYYRNSVAKGSPDNWNSAISYAQGEWVKLIHHDDYFNSPDALQYFVDEAEKSPQIDYFYCGTNILDSNTGEQFPYVVIPDHINKITTYPAYLFHRNLIGAPSTGFFKRSISLKYDKALVWLVDIEYYNRIIETYKIKHIEQRLITTVISEEQLTTGLKNNRDVEIREFLYCYQKHIGKFDATNRKIMRHRLLDLFKTFQVNDLKSIQLIAPIPTFAKLFLFCCSINKPLTYRIFYKLNHFNHFHI